MRNYKIICFALLFCLVVSNIFWLVGVKNIDLAISSKDMKIERLEGAISTISRFILACPEGQTKEDVFRLLEEKRIIHDESGDMVYMGLKFSFDHDVLVYIDLVK